MKERWTVEFEVDVKTDRALWFHVDNEPIFDIVNRDEGLVDGMEDGIHEHVHMRCSKLLDWKVVSRKPA